MMTLGIDIETFSEEDIKYGVHKYAEHHSFEITLFAYQINDQNPKIIDLACGEEIPDDLLELLYDPAVLKTAYNAAFEINCLDQYLSKIGLYKLQASQWSCTQALAAQAGLPFGLDNVAKILKTIDQKDPVGKDLVKFFAMPCKPTKSNGMRTRNLPHHDFDKWGDFKNYCIKDVLTEQAIRKDLEWFKVCDFEKDVWALDQKINDAGVLVNLDLVKNAVSIESIVADKLIKEMIALTNIENPKSNAQVKKFILEATGEDVKSLSKANMAEVNALFKETEIAKVLSIREKLNRTSIKKFTAILNSVCKDKRVKGLFQYYGANRTGRFAGRNVQLQNLKRNDLKDLDFARSLVCENALSVLELSYDDVGHVLSNLVRTAFIAPKGTKYIVSDFSAIEARIIAWLANEKWRLDVFSGHGKIYEASAAMMFKINIEDVTKDIRMKGKIAELALGYQGALGALQRMGGQAMGLSDDEMKNIVTKWRKANPKIVKLWYDVQDCVIETLNHGTETKLNFLKFNKINNNLTIELPSGRLLVYISAKAVLKPSQFGESWSITYYGMDQVSKQWCRQDTYGGKLVENIVQAIARDVLVNTMKKLDKKGFKIVMHVHDEIVVEGNEDQEKEVTNTLIEKIDWAPGLVLGAETFVADYYQK